MKSKNEWFELQTIQDHQFNWKSWFHRENLAEVHWIFPSIMRNAFLILSALFMSYYIRNLTLSDTIPYFFTNYPLDLLYWTNIILFGFYFIFTALDYKGINNWIVWLEIFGGVLPILIYVLGFTPILFNTSYTVENSKMLFIMCYLVYSALTLINIWFIVQYYRIENGLITAKIQRLGKNVKITQEKREIAGQSFGIGFVIGNILLSCAILLAFILPSLDMALKIL